MKKEKGRLGVYVHWPFCLSKCSYCDFNSHVRARIDEAAWCAAFLRSIRHYAALAPDRQVGSIFFGGGTPSLMEPDTVAAIIDEIQRAWPVANDIEITLEANPTSVESGKFRDFRAAGVNRVSLGVQALSDNDLQFLGRQHNAKEALKAIETAQENGFRYSFDLIYARPEQSLKAWGEELEKALKYADGHLSLYQLTIERGTPFFLQHKKGYFSIPDEGVAADFYHVTQDMLEAHGLPAYEVSNHARNGQESKHNLNYWRYGDYVGIGPGAHGRLTLAGKKKATREHCAPEIWLERVEAHGHGAHPYDDIPPQERFTEALMMGLRLREGVALERLEEEVGGPWQDFMDEGKIATLAAQGWLVQGDGRLRATREGLLRLNAILAYVLKAA